MKKLILLFLFVFVMFGCGSGFDSSKCQQVVHESFPNSTVFRLPESGFKFIVVNDTAVYYIETMASKAEISTKIRIK